MLSPFSLDFTPAVQTIQCYNLYLEQQIQLHPVPFTLLQSRWTKFPQTGSTPPGERLEWRWVDCLHRCHRSWQHQSQERYSTHTNTCGCWKKIQQFWKDSWSRFQIWFSPVVAAYWKYCQSQRGHRGHDLTSSQMLAQAPSLLGGRLKLLSNPPFFLRGHNIHPREPWQQRGILQNITNVKYNFIMLDLLQKDNVVCLKLQIQVKLEYNIRQVGKKHHREKNKRTGPS